MKSITLAFVIASFAIFAVYSADGACTETCPTAEISTGKIFSTQPSTYIAQYYYAGRGNLCCKCALTCASTSGCNYHLCSDDASDWPGFGAGAGRVTCQLFTASSPIPDKTSGGVNWGEQCSP